MIRFGLRLTVAGGREAALRLAIIAVAVALGVGMLLSAVAGMSGVERQNDRYGWANAALTPAAPGDPDPLWWQLRVDSYDKRTIGRVDLAATGPASPVPPGLARLPGPGEFFASPALRELLAGAPADQLGARFPGHLAGTIGPAALPAPDSLVAVVGYTPRELSARPGATRVSHLPDAAPERCPGGCWSGIPAAGLQLVLAVVAGALIFPLLILIGSATRLNATRREQRFAAMRLVGATPRQVATVAAVESTVSALAGTLGGFALFYAFRGTLAAVPFTGAPMFPADLSPSLAGTLGVGLGVPVAAALVARFALRRVRISPLGVSRRVTPRPPRAYRLVPLALGMAELAWFVGRRPDTTNGQVLAFLPGILIVMAGLVIAGPWLTMAGSRLLARRARRPASLIAARRLADDPKAGFRAVGGLVLALFVTSVAVGVMTTIAADRERRDVGYAGELGLIFRDRKTAPTGTVVPPGLAAVPGVRTVTVVRAAPAELPRRQGFFPDGLADCADIARTAGARQCEPGARIAWAWPDLVGPPEFTGAWPAADFPSARLPELPALSLVVETDGSAAAVERARTVVTTAYPTLWGPITPAEWEADGAKVFNGWRRLADVVVLTSLAIAGFSLAVTVAGGLAERKRPFSMLRLTGVPLATLRRVVALESVTPLLTAAVVSAGAGFLCAALFLRAQMHLSLRAPGVAYYVIVLIGVAASLAVIASTLPLLRRLTGPEAARND
ncbi:ABC transporter permease [Pseudosporangium ferrugineum]|uniref:FtsX-like permease family protein n=1 Tax=Pseudosporangium ferrugineum TaxID=439699 RepID=A0A2T0RNN7_9ACTN|nr:FtsX-like permease family protein [Pseudosporangium ferrugineum]PRY22804.1 FtsX-like permease family protein [Pseudosporangium ferrugineum]